MRKRAVAMIDEGNALEEQGRLAEAMARYEAAVQTDPQCARAHLNRGNILLGAGKLAEARSAYQLAIDCEPGYAAAHYNIGNLNSRVGELEIALSNYQAAISIRPDFADAFVAMANALDSLGRSVEAVESYESALAINPEYSEAHFNLGLLKTTVGRHDEAAINLRRAVEIRPDFSEAHRNLGLVLSRLEQLEAAEASHRRALALDPDSGGITYELTMILLALGKSLEALELIVSALERTPTSPIKAAFVNAAMRTKFTSNNSQFRAALTTAITEPWAAPYQLCRPALSLIMLDPKVAGCVHRVNGSWPARLPKAALGADDLAALAADSLLLAVLESTPVSTIEFERFLTSARRALLEIASTDEATDNSDTPALKFYVALARQCFINEYIFDCDDSEKAAAAACGTKILNLLDTNAVVPPLLLLAAAAYFPLYTLRDASRLLGSSGDSAVDAILEQQIREPLEEQSLRAHIARLTPITGGVSEEVRGQYEKNPFPRWVKLPTLYEARRFNSELRRALPFASFAPMRNDSAPEALIAGCGTGSHPILTAPRFKGIRILAIDLSLSSLSYAKRKTQQLGITNIEYAQADILRLGDITRTFDIIESVGVLHHLAEPFAGWRTLLSRLRPGGFMNLGFYSEIARRHVVKAREIIAEQGYTGTLDDIRRFRRDLAAQNLSAELQSLGEFPDFYSTSECRDLLFHVQEHRLTLDQIELFLADSGLHFIGFELDRRVLHEYHVRFPDDPSCTNLQHWTRFEAEHPDTFVGMYRFWIQKPINLS